MGNTISKFYKTDNAEMHVWASQHKIGIILGAGVCPLDADEKDIMFYSYQMPKDLTGLENPVPVLRTIAREIKKNMNMVLPVIQANSKERGMWEKMVYQCDKVEVRQDKLRLFQDISKIEAKLGKNWNILEPLIRKSVVSVVERMTGRENLQVSRVNSFRDSLEAFSARENALSMAFQFDVNRELEVTVTHSQSSSNELKK